MLMFSRASRYLFFATWTCTLWGLVCFSINCAFGQTTKLIVVQGAPGEAQYGEQFDQWVENWKQFATSQETIDLTVVGGTGHEGADDRGQLKTAIEQLNEDVDQVWIVLIGHGTYDGKVARFNLRGPDLRSEQLKEWLSDVKMSQVIINCASSSAPFINELSSPNRTIVTSTKSGYQYNYSRFGQYFSEVIGDPTVDLDKDGQTSLLEMAIASSNRVAEFYQSENRLATEHALIEDNHDGLGTPTEWFRGVRPVRKSAGGNPLDGVRANQVFLVAGNAYQGWAAQQIDRRNQLEVELEDLRSRKDQMLEEDYFQQLEPIMVELAKLYAAIDTQAD